MPQVLLRGKSLTVAFTSQTPKEPRTWLSIQPLSSLLQG